MHRGRTDKEGAHIHHLLRSFLGAKFVLTVLRPITLPTTCSRLSFEILNKILDFYLLYLYLLFYMTLNFRTVQISTVTASDTQPSEYQLESKRLIMTRTGKDSGSTYQ